MSYHPFLPSPSFVFTFTIECMVRFPLAAANVLSSEKALCNLFANTLWIKMVQEAKSDDGTFILPLSICLTANGCRGTSREQILKLSLGLKEMNVEVQQFIRSVAHILSITNAHDSKRMVV